MLRPERMSKVSVTGSKRVLDDVVETVHEMNLLHVTEYDGSWDGFERGDPTEGADEASDKLVTIRSLESILDVDAEDAGPTRVVSDEALEEDLAEVRERVNDLDDRRNEVESELRDVEERIEAMQPFVDLGIDLDLLSGYDSIEVAVGEGKRDALEVALAESDELSRFELFTGEDGTIAIFAQPAAGGSLGDALVGTEFAAVQIPDVDDLPDDAGDGGRVPPESYLETLQHRRQRLESKLSTLENELEEVKLDAAGFLLAAEERLSIEVQKTEAPLTFATTKNAFVAEGWIPTARYGDFVSNLTDVVGDHVEIQRLEDAEFDRHGNEAVREQYTGGGTPAAADGGSDDGARADGGAAASASASAAAAAGAGGSATTSEDVETDGGAVVMQNDDPPVVQDNPSVVKPFEVLVQAVGRPKYTEFDPTVLVFLTFPAFFGFMIGDLGYGIVYTAIGYYLYSKFESPAFRSMGGITIAAGLFTMLFGILYGEIFGLHTIASVFWEGIVGLSHAPIEKGLSPATAEWALAWLFVSVLIGIVHLNAGWILDFVENLEFHGFKHALYESGSWLLMLNGIWVWIFSESARGAKPDFIFHVFAGEPFSLGFAGFPAVVGLLGLAVFFLGLVLLIVGEPVEAVEFLNVLVNGLSYTRIAAVLLAKAGMAFTVNLLFFGVYVDSKGGWHFGVDGMPTIPAGTDSVMYHGYEVTEVLFGGLVHGGVAFVLVGLLVLVIGHALVLALGITSAGLQAVRLEYVEFFGKFFEGGGTEYEPFGYERRFTTDE